MLLVQVNLSCLGKGGVPREREMGGEGWGGGADFAGWEGLVTAGCCLYVRVAGCFWLTIVCWAMAAAFAVYYVALVHSTYFYAVV